MGRMIAVVLVITLLLSATAKPIVHRIAVPSAEECVRRGAEFAADAIRVLPPGGKATIACEFTKQ